MALYVHVKHSVGKWLRKWRSDLTNMNETPEIEGLSRGLLKFAVL